MGKDTDIRHFDHSINSVMRKMGGSLGAYAPARALGFECISALSGFEAEVFHFRHRIKDSWAIVATVSGEGNVKCPGLAISAKPGSVYIVPPGIPFEEKNTGGCAWGFACLLLRLKEGARAMPFSKKKAFCVDGGYELVGKMKEVAKCLHFRIPGFEMRALGETLAAIGILKGLTSGASSGGMSETAAKAVAAIRQGLKSPLDVPRLAARCGVSVSSLAHQFKKEIGCSPMRFQRKERIIAAKELFLAGCNIGEAASRLGFKTPFHLSRLFKQAEGITPMEFRKMARFRNRGGCS